MLHNKYIITSILFLLFCLFSEWANPIVIFKRYLETKQLEKQLATYKKKSQEIEETLQILQTDEGIEKFAREHLYMHKKDEEIIIVP